MSAEPGRVEDRDGERDAILRIVGQALGSAERLALTRAEAAESLGVSVDFFDEHVLSELRTVRIGRRRLVPLMELLCWLWQAARAETNESIDRPSS